MQMDDYKSIVSYQTQDHGYIRIKHGSCSMSGRSRATNCAH